jgi:methylenetetrahydrofolate reductase (NADPH)
MHVAEILLEATEPTISVEVIPPIRGGSVTQIFDALDLLVPFNPSFVNVTSHAAEVFVEELPNGVVKKKLRRKRPGTIGLCAAILNRYGIDPVPHLLCRGFTKDETEDALIELNYLGIHNLMALRGDSKSALDSGVNDKKSNLYAADLVQQVTDLNEGIYLDHIDIAESTKFCVGVAGYPEKHVEASDLESDIAHLKMKVEAGARFIITEIFYDNNSYFRFVEKARSEGIMIPIIPGIKVLTTANQIDTLKKKFFINIPDELSDQVNKNPQNAHHIGVEWAKNQTRELLESAVPGIHFYVMSNPKPAVEVLDSLPIFKSSIH